MKKLSLILTTLGLFSLSVALAFVQGSSSLESQRSGLGAYLTGQPSNPLFGGGVKGFVGNAFSFVMNALLSVTGQSVLLAIVLLALAVELVLLYPSVSIQLKQKKIHLFHKKVVDRFARGELSATAAHGELEKVYEVNERIHRRGALLVVSQVAVLFLTFWGLGLMVRVPGALSGSWSVMNFSLLTAPETFLVPLLASLICFFHAMVKMYYKDREDYISPAQNILAFAFAVLGSVIVYFFSGFFSVALTIYFVTLVTFSTVRVIVVEQHAQRWGRLAQSQMLHMLRASKPHENRFEYWSRKWNHLPVVRHINFALLEESVSMTLGLLLALSFFGGFQKSDRFYASERQPDSVVTVTVHRIP